MDEINTTVSSRLIFIRVSHVYKTPANSYCLKGTMIGEDLFIYVNETLASLEMGQAKQTILNIRGGKNNMTLRSAK